ncbi:MAG: PQQ-dependent sugar dehydrogenase [Polyangiaceae bacterium]
MKPLGLVLAVAALVPPLALAGCGSDEQDGTAGAASSTAGSGGSGNASAGGSTSSGGSGAVGGTGAVGGGGAGNGGGGAGGGSAFDCDPPEGSAPPLKLTPVVESGLQGAVFVTVAPGDNSHLYVVEQAGRVRIIENGAVLDPPFLDVAGMIQSGGEEGLLGLAFHPGYAENGRFFVHYSASQGGDSTVMEFKRSADPLVADAAPVQLVLQHPTAQSNHNGGAIELGPDGFLYIALGDGGAQGDPGCDAMNTANLFGKITRVDVDGAADANGYPAAPGNPDGAKYYHIGLRNPWRLSFDACTDDLYIGDVGQNAWEEIDVVPPAAGAQNFGWPVREALHAYGGYDGSCPVESGFTDPVAEYPHTQQRQFQSVSGGYVYRGSAIPGLRGTYFYADYVTGEIYSFVLAGGAATNPQVLTADLEAGFHVSSFGQDHQGELYVVDYTSDRILKIEAE